MDVSDFFYFFRTGEVKEESEAPGRGEGRIFIENPKKGGLPDGGGPKGLGGVCGELGGRGAKYFFFGAEMPTKFLHSGKPPPVSVKFLDFF